MTEFDLVIRGGTVVDGSGAPRYRADVAIKGERIAEIGKIDPSRAAEVVDAEGAIVAPGFIDVHTHYDAQLFWDPYCTLSGWHGVTSVVIGNCGFGFAPCAPGQRERAMKSMTRVEAIPLPAMQAALPWDWVTYPEFLDSLDRIPKSVNVLPYVPLGPLLLWVQGWDDAKSGKEPTPEQMAELKRLLHEAMDAGGCGWSAQRTPPEGGNAVQRDFDGSPMPTDCMSDATALEFAKVLGERNEGFMMMVYNSGNRDKDWAHYEQIVEAAGRPLLYNAVQLSNEKPNRHRRQLAWLEKCREKGLPVLCQAITVGTFTIFTFEDWNLFDDSDAWADATCGSLEEKMAKLADPARRPGLIEGVADIERGQVVHKFRNVVVMKPIAPELQKYKDKTVGEIADELGCHAVDAMLDIAVKDGLKTQFYFEIPVSTDLLNELVNYDYAVYGVSDGGAHTKFSTGGRYPTETIEKFVRELGLIDLEKAHYHLSGLPAFVTGLEDRGLIRKGYAADIVVYDYERLTVLPPEVAHDLPGDEWRRIQRAEGYRYVLVNGKVTIDHDELTNVTSGHLLRGGKSPDRRGPVQLAAAPA
jgi:N-acyl-D-aspartate/D-glutamate deacylase